MHRRQTEVSQEAEWATRKFQVSDSECLVLVTDGVTETSGPDHTLFGRERVSDLLRRSHAESDSVDGRVKRLESSLAEYRDGERQHDDVTVLAVRF